ncbi:RsmB/NOP family class I SAM-dependent RNA methyltransferase [Desulfovibrio sp.]|uniref:RsmB/NOP family class I SAM-dependent RNA methyltransferase n=1 Tax=Desulfovibrio sp. TaxID=885 RepID=UPI0023CB18BD|nr:RsmB/NOP family class I SAM-dependent RNA methyltransferase [Desulfovibrio sp.]MDE7240286.1 RsmB/NOP family class I SAM-dependent RNA methyltransferase [Desulfovibrio sp.]
MTSYPRAPPARSFRLVCEPSAIPRVEALLRAQGYAFEPEPFSPFCRRLLGEPVPLGRSLAAFFGYIYIQDRSSMLPPLALAPAPGDAVLDMCASPGSKSGFLAQLVGREGFVLANEPNPARLATLRANLHACNLLQAGTCSFPGERLSLAPASWGHILLDPPCSGWGTAEKHPATLKLWREDKVGPLVSLQRRLLSRAASLLAPGGLVLYSTCTTNEAENEAQVRFAEEELGLLRVPLAPFPGFAWDERPGGEGTLRVDGARSQAQGFYLALLRAPGAYARAEAEAQPGDARRRAAPAGEPLPPAALAGPCCDPGRLPPGEPTLFGDKARFVPKIAPARLPPRFGWQAALLGRMDGGGAFAPAPRLRCLVPEGPQGGPGPQSLVLEEVAEVATLLEGRALQTGLSGREAALWWRDLPLGCIGLRKGRALAAFR